MTELIYAGNDVQKLIAERYPDATFTDASDYVHTERFEVEVPKVSEKEFFKFAVQEGFFSVCLGIQMAMHKPPDWMKEGLEELKAERQKA